MENSKSAGRGQNTSVRGAQVLDDIAAFIDFHDAWERYLPASSLPVESQTGMVYPGIGSNSKPVPAGMLSLSSGASSGRISLIGAAPGGPEEPEEQFRVNMIELKCAEPPEPAVGGPHLHLK